MPPESSETKILVIDPNNEIRKSLIDFFGKKGYAVQDEASPAGGMDRARANPFSCIITEIELPKTDGLQFVQDLHRATPETPIVVLTSKTSVGMAVDAMQRGAHHVVQKPLLLKEVGEVVEEALKLLKKKLDFNSLLPYLTSQMLFEVPGTLSQIESVIDHIAAETLQWKIIPQKDEAPFRAVLRSALHNAVIHGNKGDEKKEVKVNFILREKSCEVAVTDEGGGFVPSKYIDSKDLSASSGQMTSGLLRIHCYMDKVSFNERGNQIRMVKDAK